MRGTLHAAASPDRAIARLATRQHGVITRAQLIALGLGRGAIAHRVANGRLHRVHRGVYLVGHAAPALWAVEMAAVLACGPGAVLSHRSAAVLWGLLPGEARDVDVTVAGRDPGRRAGIRLHRTRRLDRRTVVVRHGIPVTAPARTLIDLGEVVVERELERALEEARRRGLVPDRELSAAITGAVGRRGAGKLAALLRHEAGPALTRSEAEDRLLALVGAAKLAPPATNVRVGPYEVDLLWRAERLAVEVDGYAYHSGRAAFERDRIRDAELHARGITVVRVTWRQIVEQPEALVARLAASLALARRPPGSAP